MKRFTALLMIFAMTATLMFSSSMVFAAGKPSQDYEEHQIIINEPPANWNPETASDQELEKYAYPARPKDPKELEL